MPVSLKDHGMRSREPLDCPEGGGHSINDQELIVAIAKGGGEAHCTKCGALIHLEPIE